jgi:hypothetical protein
MEAFSEFFAVTEDVFIEGDGHYDLEVVGESHYQRHLKVLSELYSNKVGNRGLVAKLHYENTNPHDKKAIRVVIDGGTVGYLSRKEARLVRKAIEKVELEGLIISCNAKILGSRRVRLYNKIDFGVWLDLPIMKL